jgi:hypothetical protein
MFEGIDVVVTAAFVAGYASAAEVAILAGLV